MKAAIILFADTDRPEGLGRLANALTSAREFLEAGDDIAVIFDGAGVKWIPEVAQPDHRRASRSSTSSGGTRASARWRPAAIRSSRSRFGSGVLAASVYASMRLSRASTPGASS